MVEEISDSRLRWMCRRGMKELDVMVTRYHERRYPTAPAAERAAFVSLLEEVEDPDIWAWAMGHLEAPAVYTDVIEQLRIHS